MRSPMRSPRHKQSLGLAALAVSVLLAGACVSDKASDASSTETEKDESAGFVARLFQKSVVKTIPSGTVLTVEMLETVSSKTSNPGDHFAARVVDPVSVDGKVVIQSGSTVTGTVVEAIPLKKIGGRAKLRLEFTSLDPKSGDETPIQASFFAQGKSETKRDAATIGGSAVGGAVLGRILNRDHEADATAIGAVVGAGVGTAVAAATKGQEVTLAQGSRVRIRLEAPAKVSVSA